MNWKKQVGGLLLAACMVIAMFPTISLADTPAGGAETLNAGEQDYDRWSQVVNSYLVDNEDGSMTRVEYIGDYITVEDYTAQGDLTKQRTIPIELSAFGGFYSGTEYNFFVFGQDNPDEDDNTEVIRVVRYTKDWERIDAVGLYGANTYIPFDAGSLRMIQCDDMLYIRTCHEMYTSPRDGYHHQANLTFSVQISAMKIIDEYSAVDRGGGYVSHSFNQFIAADGPVLAAVDHGDAYPRAVALTKFDNGLDDYDRVNVLPIQGETGANSTGVSVGGFEISDSAYLVAGNSVAQDDADSYDAFGVRNIFVTSTPKDDFTEEATQIYWITNYSEEENVSTPQLVEINGNQYLLMWMTDNVLQYVFLDGTGRPVSEQYSAEGVSLSDCQPIVKDNRVVWYYTGLTLEYKDGYWQYTAGDCNVESTPVFCSMDWNNPSEITQYNLMLPDVCDIFRDVKETDWFVSYVQYVYDNRIMAGVSQWEFAPNTPLSRAMVVQTLYNIKDQPPVSGSAAFSDVKSTDWYYNAVQWAAQNDVAAGSDGRFMPDKDVTREQFAQFLYNYAGKPPVSGSLDQYPDADEASDWAKSALIWANQNGIINGKKNGSKVLLDPQGVATRAEAATMLMKYVENQ